MVKIKSFKFKYQKYLFPAIIAAFVSCGDSSTRDSSNSAEKPENKFYNGKGVGPVNEISLDSLDITMAARGEEIFVAKCLACHQITDERKIGPGLKGITLRRRPEWIMNQMLNPLEMTAKDSLSKELLKIYSTQMIPMNLSYEDARKVLEYLRQQ